MTNQASEDDKAIMIGFLYGIQSDFLPADEVRHRMAGFRNTQGYKDAIELIRAEKLKLLAEVRERVIGENDRGTITDPDSPSYGEQYESTMADKDDLRAELNKLEAEL